MIDFPSSRMICIVGAPRSGTTSLSRFLKDHPDVSFSSVKEPHFFSQFDLTGLDTGALRDRVETEYVRRFFPDAFQRDAILAEGSVTYLYAPERMEAILRLWPQARFVICVRDPIEMLPSLHLRLLYLGDEVETDFERAWSLTEARRQGRHIPRSCIDPRWLAYDEIARLGKYVDRFTATVGRERCFISVFDDLVSDPESVYREMLEFLELPYCPRPDFAARRTSCGYRIGALQRLLKRPPKIARGVLAGEKFRQRFKPVGEEREGLMVKQILGIRRRLLDWNSVEASPNPVPPALCNLIRAELGEDVARLSRLLGRDLDHWLHSKAPHESNAQSADPGRRVLHAEAA
jgi:hypothetical protein